MIQFKMWRFFVLGIFVIIMFFGCKKENTTWDSEVAVPLAFGTINIGDLVADSLIAADENQLWHLMIHENLTDFDLDSLVRIPDTVIRESFVVPIVGGPFSIPNGQIIINEEENNLLNVNQVELREVLIQSGFLEYSIKSYINGYLDCLYEIPGVSQNGNGVVIETTTQPASGTNPFVHSGSIDLSGYTFDLTGESGLMHNRLYTHLLISSSADAPTQTLVSGDDSIVVELKFVDPVIQYARGYFGQQNYHLEESVDLSDNIQFPSGLLNLENVSMNLDISNYVGVDARILFHELANINTQTGYEVTMAHTPLYQPINLTRAFDQSGNVIPTHVSFSMNQSNSNIDAFIENLPHFILMNADVIINPLGDISDGNDFIYTAQTLDAELSLDVPLNIGMQNLQFKDTLDIASNIELKADGHIYLHVDNWFPFTATCDAYLINEAGYLINTLCKNQNVQAAMETDVQGITNPVHSMIDVSVNENLISAFNPDNKIVIRLTMNTPDLNTPVGLYQSYKMDFQIIADGAVQWEY